MSTTLQQRVILKAKNREDITHKEVTDDAAGLQEAEKSFVRNANVKKFVGRPVKTVCIPPSVKKQLIDEMAERVESAVNDLESGSSQGSKADVERQSIIKRINTFGVLTQKIPTCTPDQMKKVVDDVVDIYQVGKLVDAPENTFNAKLERLIKDVGPAKEIKTVEKSLQKSGAARERFNKKLREIADEKGKDLGELSTPEKQSLRKEAKERMAQDLHEQTIERKKRELTEKDQFKDSDDLISKIHERTTTQLLNFVKNSKRGSETDNKPHQNIRASPCGFAMKFGFRRDGLQKAQDKLAFIGSAEDWHDYYVNGESIGKINRKGNEHITFMKLHDDDFAGCVRDIYGGKKEVEYADLTTLIGNKVGINVLKTSIIPQEEFLSGDTTLARKNLAEKGEKSIFAIVGYKE